MIRAFFLFIPFFLSASPIQEHLEKGNHATTWIERQTEWNQALQLLLHKEPTKNNLLVTAFLLNELDAKPLSLFYLKKAEQKFPNNSEIRTKIQSLENELGIIPFKSDFFSIKPSPFLKAFSIFLVLLAIFFFFQRKRLYAYSLLGIAYSLFFLMIIGPLLSPKTAIVLHPTFIYSDPTLKIKQLHPPFLAGESVEIVGSSEKSFNVYSKNLKSYGWISQKEVRPLD